MRGHKATKRPEHWRKLASLREAAAPSVGWFRPSRTRDAAGAVSRGGFCATASFPEGRSDGCRGGE
jgi:hypothetical protein